MSTSNTTNTTALERLVAYCDSRRDAALEISREKIPLDFFVVDGGARGPQVPTTVDEMEGWLNKGCVVSPQHQDAGEATLSSIKRCTGLSYKECMQIAAALLPPWFIDSALFANFGNGYGVLYDTTKEEALSLVQDSPYRFDGVSEAVYWDLPDYGRENLDWIVYNKKTIPESVLSEAGVHLL